nr:glycosyltransferase [Alcanivorax sp. VBW004]
MFVQISVVIPSFNAASYLQQTLSSVEKAIGDAKVEAIVVDDGSTDSSLALLNECAERYPWLTVISQSNSGPAVARNKGAAAAKGDFLVFLDADDELERGSLEEAATYIAENPGKDMLIGHYQIVDESGLSQGMPVIAKYKGTVPHVADYIRSDLAMQQGGYLIRRARFLELCFPTTLRTQEDIPFFLAALAHCPAMIIDVKMVRYHRYRGVVSKERAAALREGFANMDVLFESPYVCPVLQEFRGEIYRRKARGLVRYAVKNGSADDLVRVYREYIRRRGGGVFLDVRYQFKFLKALIKLWFF